MYQKVLKEILFGPRVLSKSCSSAQLISSCQILRMLGWRTALGRFAPRALASSVEVDGGRLENGTVEHREWRLAYWSTGVLDGRMENQQAQQENQNQQENRT